MKNFLLILLMMMFAFSCATPKTEPANIEAVEVIEVSEPVVISTVFDSKSSLEWVKKLAESANCVINKRSFAKRVSEVIDFDYTDDNGEQVYNKLINHKCTIRTYKTKNPWSKVIATTYKSNTVDLYMNMRANPRLEPKMINTSVHECLHNVGYGHGDNKNKNNEKSGAANNKVGWIAEQESEGCY